MALRDYEHWNEEAPIVQAADNDYDSPYCDMTDDEIKEMVYSRDYDDDDHPRDWEE